MIAIQKTVGEKLALEFGSAGIQHVQPHALDRAIRWQHVPGPMNVIATRTACPIR